MDPRAIAEGTAGQLSSSAEELGQLANLSVSDVDSRQQDAQDLQLRSYHEFVLQYQCLSLTFQQYLQLEYDEQLSGDDADMEGSSSEDIDDYETASESDRPYTYVRYGTELQEWHNVKEGSNNPFEADSGIEVCSSDGEGDACPDCHYNYSSNSSGRWPATDTEEYDKEAVAAIEAASTPEALVAWLNNEDEPTSDLDTCSEGGCSDDEGWMEAAPQGGAAATTTSLTNDGRSGVDKQDKAAAHNKAVAAGDKAALRQIRHYQTTSHNLLSTQGVKYMVDDIMAAYPGMNTTDKAVKALQVAAEDYLVKLFERAQFQAIHDADRQKLQARDLQVVRYGMAGERQYATAMQYAVARHGQVGETD